MMVLCVKDVRWKKKIFYLFIYLGFPSRLDPTREKAREEKKNKTK